MTRRPCGAVVTRKFDSGIDGNQAYGKRSTRFFVCTTSRSTPRVMPSHDYTITMESKKEKDRSKSRVANVPVRLVTFEEAPIWCHGNPHIRTGYRPQLSVWEATWSMFTGFHNQTWNAASRFVAATVFIVLGISSADIDLQRRIPPRESETGKAGIILDHRLITAVGPALVGIAFYVSKVPEIFFDGCNIHCQSHFIFHLRVSDSIDPHLIRIRRYAKGDYTGITIRLMTAGIAWVRVVFGGTWWSIIYTAVESFACVVFVFKVVCSGDFHRGSGRICDIWVHLGAHRSRPYWLS